MGAFAYALLNFAIGLLVASSAIARVSPCKIVNPKLKTAEQQYLPHFRSFVEDELASLVNGVRLSLHLELVE